MSTHISDSKINEIRERTDIVELVSQYVGLKRSGANHSGLCPFHAEKTPSFSVNAARQFYHCFGCGAGGDAFSFLMAIEGLSFPEAVRRLAERLGIDLEEEQLSPEEERHQRQRELLLDINKAATDFFHQQLMEAGVGEDGRRYLKKRGYGRNTAETFQLGFVGKSSSSLRDYLFERGFRAEDVRSLGLIREGRHGSDRDFFYGRLIVPIQDLGGRAVAFAGRVLDDSKPKYINSPESLVYHKSAVLFGLYQARQAMRQTGQVLVVEGYFDQLALYRAGFKYAVATCGTAMTPEHAKLIKRYAKQVLLLFDQDAAGRKASFKAMRVLQEEGLPSRIVELPDGDDPDSFLRDNDAEAFRVRMDAAQPAMDLFMRDKLAATGGSVEACARAAEEILGVIAGLPSELEQDLYLKKLAAESGIELELLRKERPQSPPQQAVPHRLQQNRDLRREGPADPGPPIEDCPPPPEYAQAYGRDYGAEYGADHGASDADGGYPPTGAGGTGHEVRPQTAAPPMQKSEAGLLSLMMLGLLDPVGFVAAEGQDLLRHPDAVAIASAWQGAGTDPDDEVQVRREKILEQLTPKQGQLAIGLAVEDGRFCSEIAQKIAEDCYRDLERLTLKERIGQLQTQLIPAAERVGDTALAEIHCTELSRLLLQLKGRR
jgi:DNA primase